MPIFRLIRRVADPDGRILALTYNPQFYLSADWLPMDGFYAYFKWDADYARSPWFGRGHDLCTALEQSPPSIIELDEAGTWGYRPRTYIPCLSQILMDHYVKEASMSGPDGDLYIRK